MNARVDYLKVLDSDCYDYQDIDRLSFMDAQRVYIEFREAKVGEVSFVSRDELGWIAGVKTQHAFTLDHEFPTLRLALDFALKRAGVEL